MEGVRAGIDHSGASWLRRLVLDDGVIGHTPRGWRIGLKPRLVMSVADWNSARSAGSDRSSVSAELAAHDKLRRDGTGMVFTIS